MNDDYRRYIATIDSEKIRRQYDSIVSDGDVVSKHNFRLPETIQIPHESGGTEYRDHLFISEITGVAKLMPLIISYSLYRSSSVRSIR